MEKIKIGDNIAESSETDLESYIITKISELRQVGILQEQIDELLDLINIREKSKRIALYNEFVDFYNSSPSDRKKFTNYEILNCYLKCGKTPRNYED